MPAANQQNVAFMRLHYVRDSVCLIFLAKEFPFIMAPGARCELIQK